jgi:hypothetical protein
MILWSPGRVKYGWGLKLAKELDAERLVTSLAHIKIFIFFNNGTFGLYQSGCKCDGPGTNPFGE